MEPRTVYRIPGSQTEVEAINISDIKAILDRICQEEGDQ